LSWNDAKAYADWLSGKTGKTYRPLTEAEWEYAARARIEPGTYPRNSFSNEEKNLCSYSNGANGADESMTSLFGTKDLAFAPCNDGYAYTSPAGTFAANGFGLYDMLGNAWQWTADCWNPSYARAPPDGTARTRMTKRAEALVSGIVPAGVGKCPSINHIKIISFRQS
jgi:sulfatase modifying factor 1